MRYELSDHEWIAIKSMLPDKPRGVRAYDSMPQPAERVPNRRGSNRCRVRSDH